jgi:hypothetical protein
MSSVIWPRSHSSAARHKNPRDNIRMAVDPPLPLSEALYEPGVAGPTRGLELA